MHYSVMASNVLKSISQMNIFRPFTVADCNFGLGGHSEAILNKFPQAKIKAWQLDQQIIKTYRTNKNEKLDQRITIYNQNFVKIPENNSEDKFDVILGDLGFNSLQLETINGLSWNKDSQLDMRYSKDYPTCAQLIHRFTTVELTDILIKYGDLNSGEAKIAAKSIQEAKPIERTFQLRDAIVGCFQRNKTKKIAQVFQAFRVATNGELESLKFLLQNMHKCLNKNSLVIMITFHSLERDVIFKSIKQQKCYGKIKIEKPSTQQIQENSRSHSAQMLSFRKIQ